MTHIIASILGKTTRWTAALCVLFLWNCLATPAVAAPVKPDTGSVLEDSKLPPLVQPPKPAAPPIKIPERRPDQQADDTQPIRIRSGAFCPDSFYSERLPPSYPDLRKQLPEFLQTLFKCPHLLHVPRTGYILQNPLQAFHQHR